MLASGRGYPNARGAFTLNHKATVRLVPRAAEHGKWRSVATALIGAHKGNNRYRIAGRWHGNLIPARTIQLIIQSKTSQRW